MKTFNIYKHSTFGNKAVKVGFSWPALCFGVMWLFFKKMWKKSAIYFGVYFTIIIIHSMVVSIPNVMMQILGLLGVIIAYLGLLIVLPIKGNSWQEEYLLKKGFDKMSSVQAKNEDDAIEKFVNSLPKNDPL
jgi:hypothetical protein